jgi:hypothetical protein
MKIKLIILSLLLIGCKSHKKLSGNICLDEIGIISCLAKYEVSDTAKTKFKIKGRVLSIVDSLPLNKVFISKKVFWSAENSIDKNGYFTLEFDEKEVINLYVSSEFSQDYEQKLNIILGKELNLLIYLGVGSMNSTFETNDVSSLKKRIKKENQFKNRLNRKLRKINERTTMAIINTGFGA